MTGLKTASTALRTGWSLAVPGGLLLAATAVVLQRAPAQPGWASLLVAYPWLTLCIGAVLAWRFGQGRLLLAVVALGAVDRGLLITGPESVPYRAAAVLLPVDLLLLAVISERGITSARGLWRGALLASQVVVVALLQHPDHAAVVQPLGMSLIDPAWTARTPVPQLGLAAFAAALLVLAIRFALRRSPLDAGFLWALASALAALHVAPAGGAAATTFLATAQLVLCAAVIERSHALAYRDDLTGLPGRRALNEQLDALGGRYAVAMVDIDHFKKLNDRHGHDVGDQVLRMVAGRLDDVRGGGRAYRYGGEEFTLLFRRADAEAALPHVEQLRQAIAGSRFTVRAPDRPARKGQQRRGRGGGMTALKVTVSIGLASPGDGHPGPRDVLRTADKALYKAKRGGRNLVRRL